MNKNISPGCPFMCLMFDDQTRTVVHGGDFGKQFYRASYASQFSVLLSGTSFVFPAACFSVTELQLFGYGLEREAVLSSFSFISCGVTKKI
jgi:hypothetical protein